MFRNGSFSECLEGRNRFHFKKNNKDPKLPRSYRPITLLSILGKIFERIIKHRIMSGLESQGYFSDNQHGFREEHSTITALSNLREKIKTLLQENKYVMAVSLDIEGAFDNVSWIILAEIIDNLPILSYLKSVLKNYLSGRRIGFRFSQGIQWFNLYKGCPQGSCIGPLLWLLVADELLKRMSSAGIDGQAYADDYVLYYGSDTRRSLELAVNDNLEFFSSAFISLKLKVSPEKSLAILFGSNLMESRRPIFKMNNVTIPVVNDIKYLGCIIDSKFSWMKHFDTMKEKIAEYSIRVSKTYCRDGGLRSEFRKIWYSTVIEKRISYAYQVWFQDMNSHNSRKVTSCQRLGLRTILKTYKNVSNEALCVLTGVPPILLKLQSDYNIYKVIHKNDVFNIGNREYKREDLMLKIPSKSCFYLHRIENLKIIPSITGSVPVSSFPQIFTDGSKVNDKVGAAYTVHFKGNFIYDFKIHLTSLNSVFQAELVAIKYAIDWFILSSFDYVYIYSDSYSSVQALQRTIPGNGIIFYIYKQLIENGGKIVNLGWIRAHVGFEGNERADRLAKDATILEKADIVMDLPIPISAIKYEMRVKTMKNWQKRWEEATVGRDTFRIIRKVSTDFLCYSLISQYYLSGHGSFPAYLQLIGKLPTSNCECGAEGTVFHYIFGNCTLMPHKFKFNSNFTVRENLLEILTNSKYYEGLKRNYNALNDRYSFIKYKF